MTKHSYKLYYFGIRGRGEPIRMIFKYFEVPFEDVRVAGTDWPALKPDTPMLQLPYLEVNGGKLALAQTTAICRYLAKALKPEAWFAGSTKPESARCDMYVELSLEMFNMAVPVAYGATDEIKETAKEKFKADLPIKLQITEDHLKKNGGSFLVGNKVMWCDLVMITNFSIMEELMGAGPMLREKKELFKYYLRVRHLPPIRDYIEKNWPPVAAE